MNITIQGPYPKRTFLKKHWKKCLVAFTFVLFLFLINRVFATASKPSLPKKLFDINLEIDSAAVSKLSNLSSRAAFTSFGTELTPVELTFDVLDSTGKIVHTEKDHVEVQTELIFNKKFQDAALPSGKYTLKLTTLYNVDVKDEFDQEFEITKGAACRIVLGLCWWRWIFIVIGTFILTILFIIFWEIRKNNKKYRNKIRLNYR
jgi:hypothetical protein